MGDTTFMVCLALAVITLAYAQNSHLPFTNGMPTHTSNVPYTKNTGAVTNTVPLSNGTDTHSSHPLSTEGTEFHLRDLPFTKDKETYSSFAEDTDLQSRNLLFTKDVDEQQLGTLNSTQYLVQFCNSFCSGGEKKGFLPFDVFASPRCLECSCDADCVFYGDCCPDAGGNIARDPNPPKCLYSSNDLDINSKPGFGIFMVTECSDRKSPRNNFSPVSSKSRNVSFYNSEVADCNNVTDYTPWSLELECSSGEHSGGGDTNGLDLVDHLYDNEEDCLHVYTAAKDTNPRFCDPMLASSSRTRKCNVTGQWESYDEETEAACERHDYPVEYNTTVYSNVFCAICNGIAPSQSGVVQMGNNLPPPITVITQFSRPFREKNPDPSTLECKTSEWLDPVRHSCLSLHCSPGKHLDDGDCVWDDDNKIIGDQYVFNVLLKAENNAAVNSLAHWNTVQQMFVKNFENFMSVFRTTDYMFFIGLIEDVESLQNGKYDFKKAVIINCTFIVTKSLNRTALETKLFDFATGMWVVSFDDTDHVFTAMFTNIPIARVKLKAKYWADPGSGACCLPVADKFRLKNINGGTSSRVIYVTNELFCAHVKLSKSEYESDSFGWIILKSINVSISSDDFSLDEKKQARVCVETLNDIYNGSYRNDTSTDIPTSVFAQQILSLICVSLSLFCLALTLITYFTFPALRSLPAQNNMFLMGCLFLAQLLFQFGIDKTDNQIICSVIGALIHFSWLTVIFWMNVCSFHMIRVFAVHNTVPQSRSKHGQTLLRYCLYSFGGSAFVVILTITVNLILSKGSDTGYGGVVCYLASSKLVGFAFALPLSVILSMNLTFFVVTVRAISKIENIKKHGMKERQNVYVYIKLSSLTGMFWLVAILAEVFHQDVLVYISIVLNGSLGVMLFLCYTANKRVYELWKGLYDQIRKTPLDESRNVTVSTSV